MQTDVKQELAKLPKMSTGQLCERYAEVFGETVRTRHKGYLVRKIAWRLQALAEGDLSERAKHRAEELANEADVRVMPPKRAGTSHPVPPSSNPSPFSADRRLPPSGGTIVRQYKGRTLRVDVLAGGFEYEGQRYKSLSAVAKAITGSHCNGYNFFQLKEKP